jgi:nucleotide-binding universal stress UspA family protein
MTSATVTSAISIARILVATDFSEVSDNALQYALPVAELYNSAVYVLHVSNPNPSQLPTMEFEPLPDDFPEKAAEERFRRTAGMGRESRAATKRRQDKPIVAPGTR